MYLLIHSIKTREVRTKCQGQHERTEEMLKSFTQQWHEYVDVERPLWPMSQKGVLAGQSKRC